MESLKTFTVAAVQFDSLWQQSERNIALAEQLICCADADLVVLPEMFATGFSMDSQRIAEAEDGCIVSRMREFAVRGGKAIVFSAAIADGGQFFNRLFFIEPSGEIHIYNKRHLFRMAGEHEHYAAGSDRLIVNYKGWRICPLVCYDLRFPLFSRGADQYDLLLYIASWPAARSYAWTTLLRARAIENQAFCVGVNRVGCDPRNEYSGDSVILDYLGQPLCQAAPWEQLTITSTLSMSDLQAFRASFSAHLDADKFEIIG